MLSSQDGDVLISFHPVEQLQGSEWPCHTSLEQNAVHLWGIDLAGSPRSVEQCASWLDPEEEHRAARLVREEDRRRYILAHGGLRVVLSRYLGISPAAVEMYRGDAGKPRVTRKSEKRPAIMFNMSHAH